MIDENTGNFSASRHLYDWFQNTSHVIINIMIKNLRESDVRVRLIDDTLDVSCSLANGNLFKLHFNLFKPIYVAESSWSVTPSKLEVKLKKTDRKRWQSLEQIPEKNAKRTPAMAGIVEANSPTAKKFAMSATDNQPKTDTGKPKYDWYQTELYVVVTVMIRNLSADNVNIEFGEQTADLTCKLENDSEYKLNLKLSNPIIPKESSFKVTTSKVELKMKKVESVRWEILELDPKHEPCNIAVSNNIEQSVLQT